MLLSLESLPRFTFGASSGGMFSSLFAINKRYKIQGQIIFISIVLPELLQTHVKSKSYPPTAWIYVRKREIDECGLRSSYNLSEELVINRKLFSFEIFEREMLFKIDSGLIL